MEPAAAAGFAEAVGEGAHCAERAQFQHEVVADFDAVLLLQGDDERDVAERVPFADGLVGEIGGETILGDSQGAGDELVDCAHSGLSSGGVW
ncbi:hypothetical protein SMICM17S_10104 [Streptomyces microflavus]